MKNIKGLTIIELMVAIVIMAIGILSMAGVVPIAMRNITRSRVITKASEYSQQQMEAIKRAGFSNLPIGAYESSHYNPSGDDLFIQYWKATADVNGEPTIRQVSVFTTWGPAYRETVSVASYITK
jgi:prepilin-type N-terminal cleavage/methylation domain-containing protein